MGRPRYGFGAHRLVLQGGRALDGRPMPSVDPLVAEILEDDGKAAGDSGDGRKNHNDRHDQQDRAEQDANGAGCDFVDLGCHTSHDAGSRPSQLLGMTPNRP